MGTTPWDESVESGDTVRIEYDTTWGNPAEKRGVVTEVHNDKLEIETREEHDDGTLKYIFVAESGKVITGRQRRRISSYVSDTQVIPE